VIKSVHLGPQPAVTNRHTASLSPHSGDYHQSTIDCGQ
jgi:hypothetical protein